MATKFLRDNAGSVLVETTIVMPMFLMLVLGTVDVSYMLYDWVSANKAVYIGARTAAISNPVASNIINLSFNSSNIGKSCYDGTTLICTSENVVCTSTQCTGTFCPPSSSCTSGTYVFSTTDFNYIVAAMQNVFPRVAAQNVTISYVTNNSGFVGEPSQYGGLPMNITISLKCMTHEFYFLGALMNWAFSPPTGCPSSLVGPALPNLATTMQSEDMATN